MVNSISPEALQALFDGQEPFALIDVREAGEFNSSHIPGASFLPRLLAALGFVLRHRLSTGKLHPHVTERRAIDSRRIGCG